MFYALEMSLVVLERLAAVEGRIRLKSRSLAGQLADASESVALNLAEGRRRKDGDRRRHYEIASGSASEVTVALRIAVAKRYITEAERAAVEVPLDRLRALLYGLVR
ncbi:MAG: four helix bundle protein [Kofleriaceae bacterium]|nr:four helix bundle protein [Myxococcales bacterium]MCB9559866.1 four helix bundle protein [Kofleriaceae bacterium]MCB9571478.1 four helix bundle protein [Kofleriaceae bacterium]